VKRLKVRAEDFLGITWGVHSTPEESRADLRVIARFGWGPGREFSIIEIGAFGWFFYADRISNVVFIHNWAGEPIRAIYKKVGLFGVKK